MATVVSDQQVGELQGFMLPTRLLKALSSFQALSIACVLALIFVAIPRTMADPDIWWHLRNAQQMLQQGSFVRQDTFTFTALGSPWIDHEWLAELPFYLGWRAAGPGGIYLVTAAAIEAIFSILLWLSWRSSRNWLTAGATTLTAALLATVSFGPRTLLFGWLCLVVELAILECCRRRPLVLLALPVLFAFWINLHGSWVIGLALWALHSCAGQSGLEREWIRCDRFSPAQRRMLLPAWLGSLAALFCNPWGWRLVAYPFDLAFHQTLNIANVQEWHSLDLHSLRGKLVILAVLLLLGKQLWQPRQWSLAELASLLVGLYSAFTYSRFLFLFALLAAQPFARSFARTHRSPAGKTRPAFNLALLCVLFGAVLVSCRRTSASPDAGMAAYPSQALPALTRLDPHRRLFNEFLWGGYLEWSLEQRPVFIDSRVDIFEYNGTFRDYLDMIHIHNTLALLDRHRIDYVLFERDTPLVYLLLHTSGWQAAFDDGKTVLLERKELPPLKDWPRPADDSARGAGARVRVSE